MQELTRLLTDLTVAGTDPDTDTDTDIDSDLAWTIQATSMDLVVAAATKTHYDDEVAAWEAGRNLWQAILDRGHRLADGGDSGIGTVRRLDEDSGVPRWRGRVLMVLEPI